ncbi:tryptophan synthase subunit alpha [Weeksellaceae bacterium KMM 9713]|uniref:Tryptophan synthase alpha chain n=1 Tax=Profundicola chukchiensis TaxID=2961959 RepID=A0A9X4N1W3_9FLAO|nr:tryptophan synthase subunit alpha [Profundicola chukchiensis]MDG4945099.1 tryptophan synthase subunit alpha [Profundicola chukchiensis]
MKLNIFFTAGFVENATTLDIIQALEQNGADLIEVGMPYSDPVVDGPVIQKANQIAIRKGMNISKLFKELEGLKTKVKIPVILMGYLNPVLQYGIEKFCEDAENVGVQGVIIPDLPPQAYEKEYKQLFEKHKLKFSFIVTPQTDNQRMEYLDELSDGFVYAVSTNSVTGNTLQHHEQEAYFTRLKEFKFKNECYVGFGIREKKDLDYLSQFVDGGIIGSAFMRHLAQNKDSALIAIPTFMKALKD